MALTVLPGEPTVKTLTYIFKAYTVGYTRAVIALNLQKESG